MTTPLRMILCLVFCCISAFCQLQQLHPEMCGASDSTVIPPEGLSATVDTNTGSGRLFLKNSSAGIDLPYSISNFLEACPISPETVVLFGETSSGTIVYIIDIEHGVLKDTVLSFDPQMSPDRRFLLFRKFYPRFHELSVSDEYLMYNLSKSPADNRRRSTSLDEDTDVGTAIYPLGWTNAPGDIMGQPIDRQHFLASSFFWDSGSRSILFLDRHLDTVSVVSVTIDDKGRSQARTLPLPSLGECNWARAGKSILKKVGFRQQSGSAYSVSLDLENEAGNCAKTQLALDLNTFGTPTSEVPAVEKPLYKTINRPR